MQTHTGIIEYRDRKTHIQIDLMRERKIQTNGQRVKRNGKININSKQYKELN